MSSKISVLIVDTSAFIKRINVLDFADKIVTTPSVIAEIRDPKTREYINNLPFKIDIEEPDTDALREIKNLSKKTGDFSVLSGPDFGIMALTLDYHKRLHGSYPEFMTIKPLPDVSHVVFNNFKPKTIKKYFPTIEEFDEKNEWQTVKGRPNNKNKKNKDSEIFEEDWITEDNFNEKALSNFGFPDIFVDSVVPVENDTAIKVGCMTSDFAMQNVLFHARLNLISFDKMLIKEPKARILWCTACHRVCKKKDIFFCPNCGHAQLHRIPVTLHDDGQLEFHFNKNYVPNLKGAVHPIKKPQGGQHADNPIYCADQRVPDRRLAKQKKSLNLLATNGFLATDEDLSDSFARCGLSATCDDGNVFPMNDIQSKGFNFGVRSDGQVPLEPWKRMNGYHGLRPTKGNPNVPKKK